MELPGRRMRTGQGWRASITRGDFMGLRISTNTTALAAQRYLETQTTQVKKSQSRLSSGSRINSAADDAAGLAISESMRSQTRSLSQSIRNMNDGVSVLQTAEGSMNEVGNILVRFRELSIQAASDTIGDSERLFIDKEVQQLNAEINRIAAVTEFSSNIKLLDGEGEKLDVQIGVNNSENDRLSFDMKSFGVKSEQLGIGDISTRTKVDAQENLMRVDNAIQLLSEKRSEIGALQNRLQADINNAMNYNENLMAARSRIYDVDMAAETSENVKSGILSQAALSVMAQANQTPTLALKLLQ
jgi:flagellin